ncbi:MAG: prolyl aminopeptidase [Planktomarina sp.]
MNKDAGQKRAMQYLYPPIEPYNKLMLNVGDGHSIYVEQCGNPDGVPVVVFHGGPGGGCSPGMRRYFDPKYYRVILFDQRGCGRSKPHASVEDNTTWHLVRDIELIRETLNIDTWMVFGGSWGATLGLVYAQTHPNRTERLVLRGVFLGTEPEFQWFYGGGAGQFWPEIWSRFENMIPEDERDDLIAAFGRRLFSGDKMMEIRFARAWTSWENAMASIDANGSSGESPSEYARAFARLENHYFQSRVFLDDGTAILNNLDKLANIPGTIIQGRYDMICPPTSAWTLANGWKKADIRMIPRAGHALSEPGISSELVHTMDRLRRLY